jgi:hypothetical protein
MPISWERTAEKSGIYSISDFQRATSRLVYEQVLYHSDNRQRRDYELVVSNEREFVEALNLLGLKLEVNPTERYVACVPTFPQTGNINVNEALLALVLRKLYHQNMMMGGLDKGVAGISLPELEVAYEEATGRKLVLSPRSEFESMFAAMKRWGIARLRKTDKNDHQPLSVEILPGIQSVLNESAIAMLKVSAQVQFEPDRNNQSMSDSSEEFEK